MLCSEMFSTKREDAENDDAVIPNVQLGVPVPKPSWGVRVGARATVKESFGGTTSLLCRRWRYGPFAPVPLREDCGFLGLGRRSLGARSCCPFSGCGRWPRAARLRAMRVPDSSRARSYSAGAVLTSLIVVVFLHTWRMALQS
jgi:hypothetical protein